MTINHRTGLLMLVLLWSVSCAPVKKSTTNAAREEIKPVKIDRLPPANESPAESKRKDLLQERIFLTNAGTETYLVFQQGFDLPEFCAFVVFDVNEPTSWERVKEGWLSEVN